MEILISTGNSEYISILCFMGSTVISDIEPDGISVIQIESLLTNVIVLENLSTLRSSINTEDRLLAVLEFWLWLGWSFEVSSSNSEQNNVRASVESIGSIESDVLVR